MGIIASQVRSGNASIPTRSKLAKNDLKLKNDNVSAAKNIPHDSIIKKSNVADSNAVKIIPDVNFDPTNNTVIFGARGVF